MVQTVCKYGWKKDLPDFRDRRWMAANPTDPIPPKADFTSYYPPVWNQGDTGSCTGHSGAATTMHTRARMGHANLVLSRSFLYYGARAIEEPHAIQDNGAQIRDIFKSLSATGCCAEWLWPFDPFHINNQPTHQAYLGAKWHRASRYHSLSQDLSTLKRCVAGGQAVSFGFTVYESFEGLAVRQSGVMPMPSPNEGVVGGHAVTTAAYDDEKRAFYVRNSWGTDWGLAGYFWMPYDFIACPDLASDFWTVDLMTA